MSRRQSRELALQVLFQLDLGQTDPETALFQAFTREAAGEGGSDAIGEKEKEYAQQLVRGTWDHREDIDRQIATYAKDWSVERMPAVDRNILRLAIFEVQHVSDVPEGVAVDEAVELAKLYSTAESGRFINGILGSLIRGQKQVVSDVQATPVSGE